MGRIHRVARAHARSLSRVQTCARRHALPMEPLNLRRLQAWIDSGKVDPSQTITLRELYGPGRLTSIKHGVKLLAEVGKGGPNERRRGSACLSPAHRMDGEGGVGTGNGHRGWTSSPPRSTWKSPKVRARCTIPETMLLAAD